MRQELVEVVDHVGWYPQGKGELKRRVKGSDLHFGKIDVVPSGLEGHECGRGIFTPVPFRVLDKLVLQDSLGLSWGFPWSCCSVAHRGGGVRVQSGSHPP